MRNAYKGAATSVTQISKLKRASSVSIKVEVDESTEEDVIDPDDVVKLHMIVS